VPEKLTVLLDRSKNGDNAALNELVPLVYAELRRIASSYLRRERPDHTLQPTALVNEVYLRMVGKNNPDYKDRAHFLGIAAHLMRQILTEHARRRQAAKRGGLRTVLPLNESLDFSAERASTVVAMDDALTALATIDPEQARMVELRFYSGMTAEEIASVTGNSVHRVRHLHRIALAWLHREVHRAGGEVGNGA
jgi:RNA polymerase sigma factor (TIGR02999 family)